MSEWRKWALVAGAVLTACGFLLLSWGGGWALVIVGAIAILTALLEPTYGALVGKPPPGKWKPTGERFVDPESGRMVTVWSDPETGDRRYVSDGEDAPG